MNKKLLSVTAVSALVLFGFGCSSPSEMVANKLTEKATEGIISKQLGGEGKVDLSEGTMKHQGKEGNINWGADVKLPEGFPSDVPTYGALKLTMAQSKDAQASYLGTATEKLETVASWYDSALTSKGWKRTMDENVAGNVYRQYEKDTRSVTVTLSGSNEGEASTTVTLVVDTK